MERTFNVSARHVDFGSDGLTDRWPFSFQRPQPLPCKTKMWRLVQNPRKGGCGVLDKRQNECVSEVCVSEVV